MARSIKVDQFPHLNLTCCPKCMDACGCSATCSEDNCDYCDSGIRYPVCSNITFTDCTNPSCDNTDWHI